MTDAMTGYGSEFWLEDENGVLQEMGELIALEPGAEEWGTTEATHMKSPQRRIERIKTLLDSGTGSFMLNWLPGSLTDQRVTEAHGATVQRRAEMIVPATDGAWKIEVSVLVLSRTPTIPLDDRMTCQVSLQFTGGRTEGAAT